MGSREVNDTQRVSPSCSSSQGPGTGCAEFCSLPRAITDANGTQTVSLKTVNTKLYYTNPLKLVVTLGHCFPSSANCHWLWLYNGYSGGVLNGSDCVSLDVGVGENCNVVLTTQAYPKILTSHRGLVTKQEVRGKVSDGGFLAVLPEPVLCYENASYHQQQVYNLTSDGNLILLDWVIAGRIALGEVWDMTSYVSENIVYVDGKLVSGDAISLGDDERKCSLKEFLQHTKVLGSCVFVGPYFRELKWTIKQKVNDLSGGENDGVAASARSFFRRLIEDTTVRFGGDPLDR